MGRTKQTELQSASDLALHFKRTAYCRPLRRYQQLAVEAFEVARAAGRRRSYLVLPPGAGKTVLGLEIARQLGNKTLVLCPNTAVQAQWLRQWQDFEPAAVASSPDPSLETPLTVLTYQALCNFDDEDPELDERALMLWQGTIQAARGLSPGQAADEIEQLAKAGNIHYRAELARFRRKARRLIARGGDRDELLSLLHPNGRVLVDRLKCSGPWTLVLDECHHLLEMWGYLVRALIEELGDGLFVVGLTATPPGDMDSRAAALYQELFGQADFEVPTPAVVKEGDLAPYQELAYLTQPFAHEMSYIAAQHARFQDLLLRLMDDGFGSLSFMEWLRKRFKERKTKDGATVGWSHFEREHPELADAALRFFSHHQLELPAGSKLAERHRRSPTADDWVSLIEDYCLGYLKRSAAPEDEAAWQAIRRALPSLGYVLTRQGIRSYISPVDRVLALSASKAAAALNILALEREALSGQLRALVLCDYERAGSEVLAKLRGILDPQAGSAGLLLQMLVEDPVVATLQPILLTGRTVACSRATAVDLYRWAGEQVSELRESLLTERLLTPTGGEQGLSWDDVVVIRPDQVWWQPRHYVPLLTRYFEEGRSRCLVGTRGLLGEGWDARSVNVLVDLTAAGTSTAVHQMRGRSMRLDPALPRKVANNWDVVCVAPDHPKGTADYARFVRKHQDYYAVTLEGEIESGVSHVHPALSPYGPPEATLFETINRAMLDQARNREDAYSRWQVGKPYENKETATVRIRFARPIGVPGRRLLRYAKPRQASLGLAGISTVAAAGALLGVATGADFVAIIAGAGSAVTGAGWLGQSLISSLPRLTSSDTLEDLAAAVAAALRATGGIGPGLGPDAVRVVVQSDGFYRCYLAGATAEEGQLFTESLDELLAPLAAPRYIISREIAETPTSSVEAMALLARQAITGRTGGSVVFHAVPAYLAANRQRVDAFRRAWRRFVGPGETLYYQDTDAQAILEVQRGANPFEVTSQMRTLWT